MNTCAPGEAAAADTPTRVLRPGLAGFARGEPLRRFPLLRGIFPALHLVVASDAGARNFGGSEPRGGERVCVGSRLPGSRPGRCGLPGADEGSEVTPECPRRDRAACSCAVGGKLRCLSLPELVPPPFREDRGVLFPEAGSGPEIADRGQA